MKPRNKLRLSMDYRVAHRQAARPDLPRMVQAPGAARGPMRPGNNEEGGASDSKKIASYDLTPPAFVPRKRRIAQNEGWQWLAKEIVRIAGHPPHCRKPACRRSKKCEGGRGACYLREFDTVDVTMQRFLQQNGRTLRETARAAQENAKEKSEKEESA